MRAQPNTVTAYPGTYEPPVEWVYADQLVTALIPTTDREVIHGLELLLADLFAPDRDDVLIAYGDDFTSITLKARYTTRVDKVGPLLDNFGHHHGLLKVVWLYGEER